jgi:hypothetical protein
MIIALLIVTSIFNIVLFILWYFSNKKLMKLIRVDLPPVISSLDKLKVTDIPFLIKCADTARDNIDALAKNQEILAKRIIKNEKQLDAYKAKSNAKINRYNNDSED